MLQRTILTMYKILFGFYFQAVLEKKKHGCLMQMPMEIKNSSQAPFILLGRIMLMAPKHLMAKVLPGRRYAPIRQEPLAGPMRRIIPATHGQLKKETTDL